jgi:hypothetical protein
VEWLKCLPSKREALNSNPSTAKKKKKKKTIREILHPLFTDEAQRGGTELPITHSNVLSEKSQRVLEDSKRRVGSRGKDTERGAIVYCMDRMVESSGAQGGGSYMKSGRGKRLG